MKEMASKVVDLQRTVLKLRSQLKAKNDVEEQCQAYAAEVNEYRGKYLESQKKHMKALDQVKELQALLERQQEANKTLKAELATLKKATSHPAVAKRVAQATGAPTRKVQAPVKRK